MAVNLDRRLFTAAEYERMAEAGILTEDDRVELIEGEIVNMPPIGSHHSGRTNRLNTLLNRQVGSGIIVSVQNPIRLTEHSEPQPDLALLRFRADYYTESHPTPADVLLVVEIAETSLDYDRRVKVPQYARALIPEVWIVDVRGGAIEQYADPGAGAYRAVRRLGRGEEIISVAVPGLRLPVEAIVG